MLKQEQTEEARLEPLSHSETAREALSRTAQLEEEKVKSVSAEQMDAIATETGVAARYVRHPLSEPRHLRARRPLNRRERWVLGGIPLLYGLFIFGAVLLFPSPTGFLAPFLVFFVPPLLAFLSGTYLRSKRLGALFGTLLVTCMIGGVIAAVRLQSKGYTTSGDDLILMSRMLATGILAGVSGAALRQYFQRLRHL